MAQMVKRSTVLRYAPVIEPEPNIDALRLALEEYRIEHAADIPGAGSRLLTIGRVFPGLPAPSRGYAVSATAALPDFIGVGQYYAVSERVHKLLDELEPNCHQFIPVEILSKKTSEHRGNYYSLIVGKRLDGIVDFDRSRAKHRVLGDRRKVSMPSGSEIDMVVVRKESIRDSHLWRSAEIGDSITISEHLYEQFLNLKFTGFGFTKLWEI